MVSAETHRIRYTMRKRTILLCESADARAQISDPGMHLLFCSQTSYVCPVREKGMQVTSEFSQSSRRWAVLLS